MTPDTARPSIEERYLSATQTSDLGLQLDMTCDADKLLAAAYAVSGDPKKRLALRVYRMRATGDMCGARDLAEDLALLMAGRSVAKRGRLYGQHSRGNLAVPKLKGVAMTVLKWYHQPACPECDGRGHPKVMNSPAIDETRECPACQGSGVRPVERLVNHEHAAIARWLVSEMDGLCSLVFSDMAAKLRPTLEL